MALVRRRKQHLAFGLQPQTWLFCPGLGVARSQPFAARRCTASKPPRYTGSDLVSI